MLMGNVSSATRSCERFLLLLPLVRRKSVSATAGEVNSAFPLKEIKSGTQSATDACGKRVFRSSSSISSFPVVFLSFFSRATFTVVIIVVVLVVVVAFEANSCTFSQRQIGSKMEVWSSSTHGYRPVVSSKTQVFS